MYTLITEVPSVLSEFYEEVVKSEVTGNTVAQAYTYMDEDGLEVEGERQVPEYADVTYVEQVTRPESKSKVDLERVIALGKPQSVLDKFSAMVTVGEEWAFFDEYNEYLSAIEEVTLYNLDLPLIDTDEEGVETFADPKELPVEPVKPVAVDLLSTKWSERRAVSYPPITEFADAYVKAQGGNAEEMDKYVASCLAVKASIPKS